MDGGIPRRLLSEPMRGTRGERSIGMMLAVLTWSPALLAQTADDTLRRDLVAQAEQARDAGDHARSVDLATRAALLRMTPSLGLMIAQEHEQLGHIVDALDHARRCAADASTDRTLRNRERIARNCRDLGRSLSPLVARVTVRVPPDGANATVMVGTRTVPPAGWEVPIAVDPGDVVVRASAPDGRRFEQTVHVARGASAEVVVALAAPARSEVVAVITQPRISPDASIHTMAPRMVPVRRSVGAGPWVVAGLGAVSLVVAGVLWSMHGTAVAERDGACDASGCDPSAVDADARAHEMTLGTNVAIGIGSAAIAGGLTWFLIARSGTGETPGLRPSAWLLPESAGLTLGGIL